MVQSSVASKRTIQRRVSIINDCRQAIIGGGVLNSNVQQAKEMAMMRLEERTKMIKESGVKLHIKAEDGVAFKSEIFALKNM